MLIEFEIFLLISKDVSRIATKLINNRFIDPPHLFPSSCIATFQKLSSIKLFHHVRDNDQPSMNRNPHQSLYFNLGKDDRPRRLGRIDAKWPSR